MILWIQDLLPLQNCNCSLPDPKPDLLLPVYQFLFVVVYRVSVMMQTVRVVDVLYFPVNEPLEQRIHPLRTFSTVYSHRRNTTLHSSTPSCAPIDPSVMEGWGNCTDSSTSPVDPVDVTHFLSIPLKSTIISPANRSTPQFDVHSFSLPHA